MDKDEDASGEGSGSGKGSKDSSFVSPTKQLTLGKILEMQGSPTDVIKRSSPGAAKRQSLVEILSGKMKDAEAKAKEDAKHVTIVGVAGETLPQAEIKNGSRDR